MGAPGRDALPASHELLMRAAFMVLRWSAAILLYLVAVPMLLVAILATCAVVGFMWVAVDLTRPEWESLKNRDTPKCAPGAAGGSPKREQPSPAASTTAGSGAIGSLTGSLTAQRRKSEEFYVQFGPCGTEQ